ncbi:hypothetical protein WN944_018713 [Citrus x changshan-huyou]|uniref:Uncharacterized protein n=1 Tax=Citrus x changshan-huyou TaxID=2935761 RepID=A0AAP0LUX0_9ROSI
MVRLEISNGLSKIGSLPNDITCTLDLNAAALVVRGKRVSTVTKKWRAP